MEILTSRIRQLRAEYNLTQEELAEKAGVVRQTIAYLERGEYMPSLALAWRLSRIFNVPIESIFTLEETNS